MEYIYFGYFKLQQSKIDKSKESEDIYKNCIIDKTLEYRNKIQSNTKTNNDERDNNERDNSLSSNVSNESSNNNE